MKIAIITRPDNKSPKILAQSLKASMLENGVDCDVLYASDFLKRLVPLKKKLRYKTKLHFRVRQKLLNLFNDFSLLKKLRKYDTVIVSDCIPNAYWRNYYALDFLKNKINKPLGILEVFFLDSGPNHIQALKENGDFLQGIYDYHLAISRISYQKTDISETKFEVGLNLKALGLSPEKKSGFFALIDFQDDRSLALREEQIQVLNKLGIEFVQLEGKYTIPEIRQLYKKASIFFLQKFESYGLPIAECLAYGTKVFTPDSSWPSAFRLGDNIEYYGKGELADCFQLYQNASDLENALISFREKASKSDTAQEVFDNFTENYPHFYNGNEEEVIRTINVLKKIEGVNY